MQYYTILVISPFSKTVIIFDTLERNGQIKQVPLDSFLFLGICVSAPGAEPGITGGHKDGRCTSTCLKATECCQNTILNPVHLLTLLSLQEYKPGAWTTVSLWHRGNSQSVCLHHKNV